MSWLFSSKIAKSHFYVWYLGSKEADGVRGSAVVMPVMRQLLRESFYKTPSKATVQISSKGIKLVQSVPAVSKSGKIKMQLVKFHIAANCITYSITGRAPFDDVVGVVMLVLNPEMQSPMHVHCYRCDSAETASILHSNIQILLSQPEVQRSIIDLEQRLFLSGLLHPRIEQRSERSERPEKERRKKILMEDVTRKTRDATHKSRDSLLDVSAPTKYRMFGDTLARDVRSRSMDNLADISVSTDTRGSSAGMFGIRDPFGRSYERLNMLDGRMERNKRNSIRLDL